MLLFAALDYLTPSSALGAFDCERRTIVNAVDARVGQPLNLWETKSLVRGLVSPDGSQWYASNNCGQVWTGSVRQPGARNLVAIGLCRVSAGCYNDLAIDPLPGSEPAGQYCIEFPALQDVIESNNGGVGSIGTAGNIKLQ